MESQVVCVPAIISLECLEKMWELTKESIEWGGRLLPSHPAGHASCKVELGKELVEGTAISDSSEESEKRGKPMKSASTPLHTEVLSSAPSCQRGILTNLFFHTHPKGKAPISPPSASDFAAHTVLGNLTNWRRHRQLNTALMMHHDGLYVYGIKFKTLQKWLERQDRMTAEKGDYAVEQMKRTGEAPFDVMLRIKQEVEESIYEGYDLLETTKNITPTNNPLLPVLHKNGFWYDFYAAPFTDDLEIASAGRIQPEP